MSAAPTSPLHDGRFEMPPLADPWEAATFEGAEYESLRKMAALSFAERLAWVAEALVVAKSMKVTKEEGKWRGLRTED